MVDFKKLSRPSSSVAPVDPLEIFKRTPSLGDAPNDLWKGQAEALAIWHGKRLDQDNVITLNTGAGKSIVGILIAQSLVNEQIGAVIITCSTIDLVKQTAKECDRMGIKYSIRAEQKFSNTLFEEGTAFCITTYQSIFSSITAFTKQNVPAAVIFDDAHVAERLIRDAFTLSISKEKHPQLYHDIIGIVRPHFDALNKGPHLDTIISGVGQHSITLCPPSTASKSREQIIEALKRADYRKKADIALSVIQIYGHIQHCAIFISPDSIEITPPFIPTGHFGFLGGKCRRIYLSATLEYQTDFIRAFGRSKANYIAPDNDAGNGERLILLASDFDNSVGKKDLATSLLKRHKLLVTVTSYSRAKIWSDVAQAPSRELFSSELDKFRKSKNGAFILVSRIDGIDLPHDTCRIMVIDGIPSGASLMERYMFQQLDLSSMFSTKMAGRITQLLGRINRGRSDFGAFIIFGNDVTSWIKRERNIALLPPLIRKQVFLGRAMQKDIGKSKVDEISKVIDQVIDRDKDWIDYYSDNINGIEISNEVFERVRERESQLAKSAVAECRFMTSLWQEDVEGARRAILDVLDATALSDARLAGWYSIWLAMTYENEGDMQTALAHYRKARARLYSSLNVPFRGSHSEGHASSAKKTTLQESLQSTNHNGPQALGDLVAKLRARSRALLDSTFSSSQHEESLRMFGELIGFTASRPDNEFGQGPDVIWRDDETKALIAFELKTKKQSPSKYTKDDIGQSHNHLQWLDDTHGDYKFGGVLIVGPAGSCGKEASPSDRIFFVETKALCDRFGGFIAQVDDTRTQVVMDRWAAIDTIGTLPDWQIDGWHRALASCPISSLKRE